MSTQLELALANLAPVIFPADATFIRQVSELEEACFALPWPLREVRSFLALSGEVFGVPISHHGLVAFVGGRLAGYALATYRHEDTAIHRLATLAEFRGRGVARCLLAAIELRSWKREAGAIYCVVRESNLAGQLFFKACGFRAPAEEAIQPEAFPDHETGYVLVRELGRPAIVRIVE